MPFTDARQHTAEPVVLEGAAGSPRPATALARPGRRRTAPTGDGAGQAGRRRTAPTSDGAGQTGPPLIGLGAARVLPARDGSASHGSWPGSPVRTARAPAGAARRARRGYASMSSRNSDLGRHALSGASASSAASTRWTARAPRPGSVCSGPAKTTSPPLWPDLRTISRGWKKSSAAWTQSRPVVAAASVSVVYGATLRSIFSMMPMVVAFISSSMRCLYLRGLLYSSRSSSSGVRSRSFFVFIEEPRRAVQRTAARALLVLSGAGTSPPALRPVFI